LRLPPRYDDQQGETPPLARSLSISSVNSSTSTDPKTPKNASYASRKGGKSSILDDQDTILEEQQDIVSDGLKHQHHPRKQHRRLSSPAERTKRQSHTFPNRNNAASGGSSKKKHDDKEEDVAAPIIGGSLGHKLDRQYRETANEILAKKPSDEAVDLKEEKLLLHSKDGLSTTHYVRSST
jgi:hypothetical protein